MKLKREQVLTIRSIVREYRKYVITYTVFAVITGYGATLLTQLPEPRWLFGVITAMPVTMAFFLLQVMVVGVVHEIWSYHYQKVTKSQKDEFDPYIDDISKAMEGLSIDLGEFNEETLTFEKDAKRVDSDDR